MTNVGAATQVAAPRHSWASRIVFGTFFALVLLATSMVKFILSLFRSSPDRPQRGFVSDMAHRAAGDYVKGRLRAGTEWRYTQTFRIQDSQGQQYAARVDGMLVSGSVAPGDHVDVEGVWDGSFFLVSSGFNRVSRTPLQIINR